MNVNILICLIVAVVTAAAVVVAFGYPYLQAKLAVIFAGGIVCLLALVQLVRELRRKKQCGTAPEGDERHGEREASVRQYAVEAIWMAGFGVAIHLLGFVVAIPCFICSYMKAHGTGWPTSIITAVLMAACCYGLFSQVLDLKLYSGLIFARFGL